MKTNKRHTFVTTLTTIGLLSAASFTAHAGGPDFTGQVVKATDLVLADTAPDLKFDDTTTGGGNHEFEIELFQDVLSCFVPTNGWTFYSFHKSDGSIGFGNNRTSTDSPYHFRPTGTADARILCDNKEQNTTIPRNMFHLRNNGSPRFVLEDTSQTGTKKSYTFAMNPQGNFTMTRVGVPGAELTIKSNGEIEMGPGTTTSFRVTRSGVQSTSFTTLSDREAKTDIEEVKSEEILDKLKQLPVSTWRFKSQEDDTRHIGPMAQDFHQTFGDGTNKNNTTINLGDMAGVALAGVKSLDEKVEVLENEIVERDQTIEALEERLDRLEALLSK